MGPTEYLIKNAWAAAKPLELTAVCSHGAGSPAFFKDVNVGMFNLPECLGHVKDAYAGTGNKIVIHIQDAHCNYAAQRKVAEIIGYLNKEYGIDTVNLEGGKDAYDLSIFTRIYNKEAREKVADLFVKEGSVNGAEYFAINNPEKVILWGVEDAGLYLENLKVYRESIKYKDEADKHIKALSHILDELKKHIYTDELLELDTQYSRYKANDLEFKDYLTYIINAAGRKAVDIRALADACRLYEAIEQEEKINFRAANNERDELINIFQKMLSAKELEGLVLKTIEFKQEQISQKEFYSYLIKKADLMNVDLNRFPELQKYVAYISMYQTVNKDKALEEVDTLERWIREAMYKNDAERELGLLSKRLALTRNIFNVTLTKDDYKYYRDHEDEFAVRNFTSFIQKEAPLYKITAQLDKTINELDKYRNELTKFYEYSFERDNVFLKNIKFKDDKQVSILVTGGFHTENLCGLFRKEGISYVSIMPNFKNDDGYESPYFNILAGKRTPLQDQLYPIVTVSSMQVPSLLSASAIQICEQADIDIFKAEVWLREQMISGAAIAGVAYDKKTDRVVFTLENGQTVSMARREFLDGIHQEKYDDQLKKAKFEDIENIDQILKKLCNFLEAIGADEATLKAVGKLNNEKNDNALVRFAHGIDFKGHAGGYGIRINGALKNKDPIDVEATILHEIIAAFFGNHFLAGEVEAAFRKNNRSRKILEGNKGFGGMAIWDMAPEERLGVDRDFAQAEAVLGYETKEEILALKDPAIKGQADAAETLKHNILHNTDTDLVIEAIRILKDAVPSEFGFSNSGHSALKVLVELMPTFKAIISDPGASIELKIASLEAIERGRAPGRAAIADLKGELKSVISDPSSVQWLKMAAILAFTNAANYGDKAVLSAIEELVPDLESMIFDPAVAERVQRGMIYMLSNVAARGGNKQAMHILCRAALNALSDSVKTAAFNGLKRIIDAEQEDAEVILEELMPTLKTIIMTSSNNSLVGSAIDVLAAGISHGSRKALGAMEELSPMLKERIRKNEDHFTFISAVEILNTAASKGNESAINAIEELLPVFRDTSGTWINVIGLYEKVIALLTRVRSPEAIESVVAIITGVEEKFHTEESMKIVRAEIFKDNVTACKISALIITGDYDESLKIQTIEDLVAASRDHKPAAEALTGLEPVIKNIFYTTTDGKLREQMIEALAVCISGKGKLRSAVETRELSYAVRNLLHAGIDVEALETFIMTIFRKQDTSAVNILYEASYNLTGRNIYTDMIGKLLESGRKYESIRDALGYIAELNAITASYDSKSEKQNTKEAERSYADSVEKFVKGNIGQKAFLKQIKRASLAFKTTLFRELVARPVTQEEIEKIYDRVNEEKLNNLLGLCFRLQKEEGPIVDKIRRTLDKLVEMQQSGVKELIPSLNKWLNEEADWNKKETEALVKAGYDISLWREGIVVEEEVASADAGKLVGELKKQTEQIVEIAGELNIPVSRDIAANGLGSYEEARQFVDNVMKPGISDAAILSDLERILTETKALEAEYAASEDRKETVRVEIRKDFLADAYGGMGVPGCFNPITGAHREMPLVHALEANGFFLKVYLGEKMIANAVIVLTDDGVMVFGLYNSTNLYLDKAVFEAIKELAKKIPGQNGRICMVKLVKDEKDRTGYRSAAYDEAEPYGETIEQFSLHKRENVYQHAYHDVFAKNENGNSIFDGSINAGRQMQYEFLVLTRGLIDKKGGFRQKLKRAEKKEDNRVQQEGFDWNRLAHELISNGLKEHLFIIQLLKSGNADPASVTPGTLTEMTGKRNRAISGEDAEKICAIINAIALPEAPEGAPSARQKLTMEVVEPGQADSGELAAAILELQKAEWTEENLLQEDEIQEALQNPGSVNVLVRNEEGELVGYIIGRPLKDARISEGITNEDLGAATQEKSFYIDDIFIHPEYRGQLALAGMLFKFRTEALKKGYTAFFIHARMRNPGGGQSAGDFLKSREGKEAEFIRTCPNWDYGEDFELWRVHLEGAGQDKERQVRAVQSRQEAIIDGLKSSCTQAVDTITVVGIPEGMEADFESIVAEVNRTLGRAGHGSRGSKQIHTFTIATSGSREENIRKTRESRREALANARREQAVLQSQRADNNTVVIVDYVPQMADGFDLTAEALSEFEQKGVAGAYIPIADRYADINCPDVHGRDALSRQISFFVNTKEKGYAFNTMSGYLNRLSGVDISGIPQTIEAIIDFFKQNPLSLEQIWKRLEEMQASYEAVDTAL